MDYLTYVTTHRECDVLGSKEGVFHIKLEEIGVTKQKRQKRVLIQPHALYVTSAERHPRAVPILCQRRGEGLSLRET